MGRRALHIVTVLALVACIASIVDSAFSSRKSCPFCGRPMQHVGLLHSLAIDQQTWRPFDVYRCPGCDFVRLEPAGRTQADANAAPASNETLAPPRPEAG